MVQVDRTVDHHERDQLMEVEFRTRKLLRSRLPLRTPFRVCSMLVWNERLQTVYDKVVTRPLRKKGNLQTVYDMSLVIRLSDRLYPTAPHLIH
jgi:hypothetical protein